MYGVPHGRGANLLMWRTDKVDAGARQLERRLGRELAVQGQGDGVRQPDLHRGRGALPEGDPARPGDRERRTSSTTTQFQAAIDLLKKQREIIGEYWSDYTKEQAAFTNGDTRRRHDLAGDREPARRRTRCTVETTLPKEGSTGWSDTWMISSEAEHPNCMYMWMNHIISPGGERRRRGVVRRGAVEQQVVRR